MQLEAPPEHGIVERLAGMAGDRLILVTTVYFDGEVELSVGPSDERGAELGVESAGHALGQRPGKPSTAIAASVARR